jgi:TRIAP1/MDM35 family protein
MPPTQEQTPERQKVVIILFQYVLLEASMSQSLSQECTPLKQEYDTCFNSWFEGYLEPAVTAGASAETRAAYSKKKADEFNAKCGKVWEQYKSCVQVR